MSFRAVLHVCPVFLAGRMTSWVFQGSRAIQCVAVHCREGVPFVALKLNASSSAGGAAATVNVVKNSPQFPSSPLR